MNNTQTRGYGYYPIAPNTQIPQQYYQPQYYQTPNNVYGQNFQAIQPNNEMTTNIQFVESQNAAESYILPNGVTSWSLWDAKEQIIYVKSFDSNGRPFTKRLQYIDLDAPPEPEESKVEMNYVTQEQFAELSESFTKQMADLQKKLNDFKSRICNTNKKEK